YHITLETKEAQIDVPPIELHADHGRGKIIVQDGIITLVDVHGHDGRPSSRPSVSWFRAPRSVRLTSLRWVTSPSVPVLRMMSANCSASTSRPRVLRVY